MLSFLIIIINVRAIKIVSKLIARLPNKKVIGNIRKRKNNKFLKKYFFLKGKYF